VSSASPSESFRVTRGGVRLDRVVAEALGCGRRAARELLRSGRVLVDGRTAAAASAPPRDALIVVAAAPAPAGSGAVRDAGTVSVLWEGDGLLAVSKPAGLHSQRGRERGSVADFLAVRYPGIAEVGDDARECGLVHRLDRDTSGVLLAATTRRAYRDARRAFAEKTVAKSYLALVRGAVESELTIDTTLARRRTRVVPARRGDRRLPASTGIEPLEQGGSWSLVRATMRTGVTHQVRAHLALAGHPIIGDLKYGQLAAPAGTRDGQLLHASRIVLPDGTAIEVDAPDDFEAAHALLAAQR